MDHKQLFFETMLLPQHCWAGGYQQAGEELVEVGGGYFPKHKEPLSEDVMKAPNVSNRPKQWRSQTHVVLSYLAALEGVFTNIIPSSPHFFPCCFTDDHTLAFPQSAEQQMGGAHTHGAISTHTAAFN